VRGFELIGQSLDYRGVDATAADGLTIRGDAGQLKIGIDLAIAAGLFGRALAADHGNVIIEARMSGAKILDQQGAFCGQRLG
jgi:hypothetical protein